MSDCKFCNGKIIKADGDGLERNATKNMLGGLVSVVEMNREPQKEHSNANGGIMLKDGNILAFDNSSGEYTEMKIQIHFCPFCGKELF